MTIPPWGLIALGVVLLNIPMRLTEAGDPSPTRTIASALCVVAGLSALVIGIVRAVRARRGT